MKYYRQQRALSAQCFSVSLRRVQAMGLYEGHKTAFNALASFFKDHRLNVSEYLKYFAENLDGRDANLDRDLLSRYSLEKYYEWLHGIERRRRIYGWFMKSARNLAAMCVDGGYMSAKDCFIDALREKRLSQLVVSGQISAYFLAAIPGFKNVIPKLDAFARQDLAELYDRFDMYSTDVNEAVLHAKNRRANPFKIAQEEVMKLKSAGRRASAEELFDPRF